VIFAPLDRDFRLSLLIWSQWLISAANPPSCPKPLYSVLPLCHVVYITSGRLSAYDVDYSHMTPASYGVLWPELVT